MGSTQPRPPRPFRRLRVTAGALAVLAAASACATPARTSPTAAGVVRVVAAESFWGSLAGQLGGTHAQLTSVIDNPNTDPHDYEPTASDARSLAVAQMVVVNGVGYDGWAAKLLAANPVRGREVVDVGDVVGVAPGGNPHRWYAPDDVRRVIAAISAAYKLLDPADAAYFDAQRSAVLNRRLKDYFDTVAAIKTRYAGTPIGASESIVTPLAQALGLEVVTPPSFMKAISEGSDPTAADKTEVDRQIRGRQIKVLVYNSQNATPDVRAEVEAARHQGIPVVTVTETLTPAGAPFQQWQVGQLRRLLQALSKATGR